MVVLIGSHLTRKDYKMTSLVRTSRWLKTLSIEELSTWIKDLDKHEMLPDPLPNYMYLNIREAKRILKK